MVQLKEKSIILEVIKTFFQILGFRGLPPPDGDPVKGALSTPIV
jgi:hypothetical protein